MFGTANRRPPSTPATPPAVEAVEANRAPGRQPLQRPANHPNPVLGERLAMTTNDSTSTTPAPKLTNPMIRSMGLAEERRLTIARDIRLSGELKSCEGLIVEGAVSLDLQGTKYLEVMEGGTFGGSAVVETAEIAGTFEGDLTVSGLLVIHPTGLIEGSITVGELQLERGGTICGNVQMAGKSAEREARLNGKLPFSRRQELEGEK